MPSFHFDSIISTSQVNDVYTAQRSTKLTHKNKSKEKERDRKRRTSERRAISTLNNDNWSHFLGFFSVLFPKTVPFNIRSLAILSPIKLNRLQLQHSFHFIKCLRVGQTVNYSNWNVTCTIQIAALLIIFGFFELPVYLSPPFSLSPCVYICTLDM